MEAKPTKLWNFELMLTSQHGGVIMDADDFLDSVEEQLFEAFEGDVTPATVSGMAVLYCSIEGASIEDAVHRVAAHVVQMGLHPEQIVVKFGAGGLSLV